MQWALDTCHLRRVIGKCQVRACLEGKHCYANGPCTCLQCCCCALLEELGRRLSQDLFGRKGCLASCPSNRAYSAFVRFPQESVQRHTLIETGPARVVHFWPGQLLSCGVLGLAPERSWHHGWCGKGSEPQQDWPGQPQSTSLWGYLWHLGALLSFPSHSHYQWWWSSLSPWVLPISSTSAMLSVLHSALLALTIQVRISLFFFFFRES